MRITEIHAAGEAARCTPDDDEYVVHLLPEGDVQLGRLWQSTREREHGWIAETLDGFRAWRSTMSEAAAFLINAYQEVVFELAENTADAEAA